MLTWDVSAMESDQSAVAVYDWEHVANMMRGRTKRDLWRGKGSTRR